ncbi:putative ATP-dependent RNA helicase DDX52 [Sarcoptes scabiei]|nr:putative ATP-dependent RNA helicase DDX52 [Sarcoptes scabiei]
MKRRNLCLSKNLLQMKFMQKSRDRYEAETNESTQKNCITDQNVSSIRQDLIDLCRIEGDRYLATSSFIICENLRYGRMSFKGMNPEIEQLMRNKNLQENDSQNKNDDDEDLSDQERKYQTDISDIEMSKVFKKRKKLHH